ncbi:DUF7147 family protein [Metabacillus malikii]|uniref:DUF7147 domain-containing protein n=1 Tax=Metabacillus malikii TaxID=1504265 RepID=A0ABT9ZG91_9BACI|nr:methylthioribose kinase [Metabacillus malikii]MDQ0231293.1 hypothetical protein [Metabacillus malikii]
MIQRFIELGEGYSDIYELIETAKSNHHRVSNLLALHTTVKDKPLTSLVVAMSPTNTGNFQALYICREGIPNPHITQNKRYDLFKELSTYLNKDIIEMDVKPSTIFKEKELYFHYLIGILRLNHLIPPLQ